MWLIAQQPSIKTTIGREVVVAVLTQFTPLKYHFKSIYSSLVKINTGKSTLGNQIGLIKNNGASHSKSCLRRV